MQTDYLKPEIYNKLFACMTYENILALRVALETGLRIGDVLKLTPADLKEGYICGVAEKTDKQFKKKISSNLYKMLCRSAGEYYVFENRLTPTKHRTRQAVWSNLKKAAEMNNIELNIGPHSARKTYAVETFKDKGFRQAQKELQHDNMTTTMLYVFSELLTKNTEKTNNIENNLDLEEFADIIAEKVLEKIKQKVVEKIKQSC